MKTLQEFVSSGLTITNDYNELRESYMGEKSGRIIFPNGWYASIVHPSNNKAKYSVAVADYEGYFNWNILKPFGANEYGCILCNTEEEICNALTVISMLK